MILFTTGESLRCHKSFLALNSPVFDRMLNSDFKETNTESAEIKGFDLETVNTFLEYVYADKKVKSVLGHDTFLYQRDIDEDKLTAQLLRMSHM